MNSPIKDLLSHLSSINQLAISLSFELQSNSSPFSDYISECLTNCDCEILTTFTTGCINVLNNTSLKNVNYFKKIDLETLNTLHKFTSSTEELAHIKKQTLLRSMKLVSTRSFYVDDYYKESMIPFADLFNHSIDEDVHMETIVDVCESCGDVGCSCGLPVGELDSFSEQGQEDDGYEDEEDSEENEDHTMIEIKSVKKIPKGIQVFNTFGKLSNSELLLRYGFAIKDNPYDLVHFSRKQVEQGKDEDPFYYTIDVNGKMNRELKELNKRDKRWKEELKRWFDGLDSDWVFDDSSMQGQYLKYFCDGQERILRKLFGK